METQIKKLKIKIDGLSQLVYNSNDNEIGGSSQMYDSYKSLILAKAWLGKILQQLGTESPYKSGYKTKEDIEPTADEYTLLKNNINEFQGTRLHLLPENKSWKNINHIEKIDWLRTEIENLINNTTDFSQEYPNIELEQSFVYKYLCEARFWLGFELQRIKETK